MVFTNAAPDTLGLKSSRAIKSVGEEGIKLQRIRGEPRRSGVHCLRGARSSVESLCISGELVHQWKVYASVASWYIGGKLMHQG